MRIDVGASTLQNSEPRGNIFGTGPKFLTEKIVERKIGTYLDGREQLLHCAFSWATKIRRPHFRVKANRGERQGGCAI
jgi:hypothetical protein